MAASVVAATADNFNNNHIWSNNANNNRTLRHTLIVNDNAPGT